MKISGNKFSDARNFMDVKHQSSAYYLHLCMWCSKYRNRSIRDKFFVNEKENGCDIRNNDISEGV